MDNFKVMLSSIDEVKEFVRIANLFEQDIDLVSGRYVVDAKSIMGIFSLDLSKPILVEVHSDHSDALREKMDSFILKPPTDD